MLTRPFIVALLLIAAFGAAKALAHHQGDYFPISRSLFIQELEMEATGEWAWSYRQDCSSGNIGPDIVGAFADTQALFGVQFVEYWAEPKVNGTTQKNISTCGAAFIGACGATATACVGSDYPGYPRNCDAKYNGPYMATFYSFQSRKSVGEHEWMHCSTRRAEGYKDDGGDLTCIPSVTIMGCGPNSPKAYSSHDVIAWAVEHWPAKLTQIGLGRNDGGLYVYWCSPSDRSTRVSVLYEDSGNRFWSGIHTPNTVDANGCRGQFVEEWVGRCYYVKAENAVSWYAQFSDVLAGCM